jgi:hypothetical protein
LKKGLPGQITHPNTNPLKNFKSWRAAEALIVSKGQGQRVPSPDWLPLATRLANLAHASSRGRSSRYSWRPSQSVRSHRRHHTTASSWPII